MFVKKSWLLIRLNKVVDSIISIDQAQTATANVLSTLGEKNQELTSRVEELESLLKKQDRILTIHQEAISRYFNNGRHLTKEG